MSDEYDPWLLVERARHCLFEHHGLRIDIERALVWKRKQADTEADRLRVERDNWKSSSDEYRYRMYAALNERDALRDEQLRTYDGLARREQRYREALERIAAGMTSRTDMLELAKETLSIAQHDTHNHA